MESPINFKYRILNQGDQTINLEIQVYEYDILLKTEESEIVFVDSDKIIIGGDDLNVVSKTFIRKN